MIIMLILDDDDVDGALGHLPTREHQACFRLLTDAVVSRHHLRGSTTSGWPSFVVVGPTKTGKSLLAHGVCRIFGLETTSVVRSVPAETERSLWGRRHQLPGGGWALRPSPVLDEPFLALDELDKAPAGVQRACLKLLQGESVVPGEEGERVEVTPTVMVLSNGRAELLPPEYRRRSVVLDTTSLVDQLGDIARCASAFLEALPQLDLDAIRPPTPSFPSELAGELTELLRAGLSPEGYRIADERGLGLLTLGRAAWCGADLHGAMTMVVADYLDPAATMGEQASPPSRALALPDAEARRQAEERRAEVERARRIAEHREDLALAHERAVVVAVLLEHVPDPDDVDPRWRQSAIGIGGQLRELAAKVSEASDMAELEELAEVAVEVIEWRVANLPALDASELPDDGDVIDAEVVDESYEARSAAAVLAALRQQQRSRIAAQAESRNGGTNTPLLAGRRGEAAGGRRRERGSD